MQSVASASSVRPPRIDPQSFDEEAVGIGVRAHRFASEIHALFPAGLQPKSEVAASHSLQASVQNSQAALPSCLRSVSAAAPVSKPIPESFYNDVKAYIIRQLANLEGMIIRDEHWSVCLLSEIEKLAKLETKLGQNDGPAARALAAHKLQNHLKTCQNEAELRRHAENGSALAQDKIGLWRQIRTQSAGPEANKYSAQKYVLSRYRKIKEGQDYDGTALAQLEQRAKEWGDPIAHRRLAELYYATGPLQNFVKSASHLASLITISDGLCLQDGFHDPNAAIASDVEQLTYLAFEKNIPEARAQIHRLCADLRITPLLLAKAKVCKIEGHHDEAAKYCAAAERCAGFTSVSYGFSQGPEPREILVHWAQVQQDPSAQRELKQLEYEKERTLPRIQNPLSGPLDASTYSNIIKYAQCGARQAIITWEWLTVAVSNAQSAAAQTDLATFHATGNAPAGLVENVAFNYAQIMIAKPINSASSDQQKLAQQGLSKLLAIHSLEAHNAVRLLMIDANERANALLQSKIDEALKGNILVLNELMAAATSIPEGSTQRQAIDRLTLTPAKLAILAQKSRNPNDNASREQLRTLVFKLREAIQLTLDTCSYERETIFEQIENGEGIEAERSTLFENQMIPALKLNANSLLI